MITTSHAVINAAIDKRFRRGPSHVDSLRIAIVAGGLAPDVALYLLNLGTLIYYPLVDGMSFGAAHDRAMYDLYFNSTWWIVAHNLLHAPLLLSALYAGAALLAGEWKRRVRYFAVGALLHSLIDVVVHHDDGPLVLFPFSLSIRFTSPVSYWDPDHYGWIFRPFDLAVTIAGIIWLARWWRSRHQASSEQTVSA